MLIVRINTPTSSRQFTFSGSRQQLIEMLRKQYPANAQVEIK